MLCPGALIGQARVRCTEGVKKGPVALDRHAVGVTFTAIVTVLVTRFLGLGCSISTKVVTVLDILSAGGSSILATLRQVTSAILTLAVTAILFQVFKFRVVIFKICLLFCMPLTCHFALRSKVTPYSILIARLLLRGRADLP